MQVNMYLWAMKILVIQQKMIGDVLVSSVLCEHLKEHLPHSKVHYLVNDHTVAVVDQNPFIDELVIFKKEFRGSRPAFYRFLKNIRGQKYDAVIDIYGKIESNLATVFSGARIKIAYPKWYSRLLFTHTVQLQPRREGDAGLTIADRLGLLAPLITNSPSPEKRPKIYLGQQELEEAHNFLVENHIDLSKPVYMIAILGSGANKTYPTNYMVQVLDLLVNHTQATLLFNYMPPQEEEALEVYRHCNSNTQQRIALKAFAPSLRKFLGLLAHCQGIIGNEGGTINMAKALNVPTFAIYSPWVSKMGWHTFADDKNLAVHLNDYLPELFRGKNKKELRAMADVLYEKFVPELYKDELVSFIARTTA